MVFLLVIGFIIGVPAWVVFVFRLYGEGQWNFKKNATTPLSLLLGGLGFLPALFIEDIMEDEFGGWYVLLIVASILVGGIWYFVRKNNESNGVYKREREQELLQIEVERRQAIASQNQTEPWAKKYMTSPCPYCGHYKVRWAKWEDKQMSVAFWGGASSKIGTNYKCEKCGRMWE